MSKGMASMVAEEIGFGIVGCGMIAGYHAQAIKAVAGARLIAAVGRDAARTRSFAARHGGLLATTDIEELLALPDVHVVCITTPSGAHLDPALAAIRKGKHVLVEKPMEITADRATRIVTAAAEAGVLAGAVFQSRLTNAARAMKTAVDQGRFGRMVLASAAVKWHRSPEYYRGSWKGTRALDGGGALMNQGIHAVDLLQWLVGLPVDVQARTTRRVHLAIEVEDTAVATLRFGDGALGSIEATTAAYPGWERRIELCGETGSAVLEDDRIARWDFRQEQPGDAAIRAGSVAALTGSGASAPDAITFEGHKRQIENMVDALRKGIPLEIDGGGALNAIKLIQAIYAAAESGQTVAVDGRDPGSANET